MICFILPALYAGLIIGVSFSAAIKFAATNLTLKAALEIGNITFNLFNKIEWLLLVVLSVTSYLRYRFTWPIAGCYIILIIQTVYLLPKLNERFMIFLHGIVNGKSLHHTAYILCEIGKVILLFYIMYLYSKNIKNI